MDNNVVEFHIRHELILDLDNVQSADEIERQQDSSANLSSRFLTENKLWLIHKINTSCRIVLTIWVLLWPWAACIWYKSHIQGYPNFLDILSIPKDLSCCWSILDIVFWSLFSFWKVIDKNSLRMKNSSSWYPKFKILVRCFISDSFAALTLLGIPKEFFWWVLRFLYGLTVNLPKFFPCFGSDGRKFDSNFSHIDSLVEVSTLSDSFVTFADDSQDEDFDRDIVDVDILDSVSGAYDGFIL